LPRRAQPPLPTATVRACNVYNFSAAGFGYPFYLDLSTAAGAAVSSVQGTVVRNINSGSTGTLYDIATGGLLAPSAALLGEYAIATATQDFFFVQGTGATSVGVLTMNGFDPMKRYVFHRVGSRVATTEMRITQYRLTGATTSTVLLTTTGPNVGANGYAGNNNTLATSDTLTADASGVITLEMSKNAGQYT
jgi:hypothetical protein